MNPSDAKSVFGRAAEIPDPSARAAYLDGACAGRPEVRAEVETLLRALGAAGSFMRGPAAGPDATGNYDGDISEGEGTVIGPYTLRELIGEGGMGLVFVAEQTHPVRRKVALKVIKPGMDTRQVVARFEAERQALALMDHPHIAKVLDAGTTVSGLPYFVMELVRGVPITEYCDANNLPPKDRLALFVQVCHAVQHAHQKGVIHRDLKPSNILVAPHDGIPVVKVIDFGVAKAVGQSLTEKTIYTRLAQMIGTPLYMSPEQAEVNQLDVDTRSDVYSLGVLLYELLTGTTPFDGDRFRKAAFDEVRRIIREEEPPRPSTRLTSLGATLTSVSARRGTDPARLAGLVRGELDWLVMKCLEKDRTRRYDGAAALAQDVERYLAGDAVEACPPTLGYRVRKAYRRNRVAVLGGAAFALVLLTGVCASLAFALAAKRAGHEANANAEDARQAQVAATEQRDEAVRLGSELRRSGYLTSINLAAASLELGQVSRTRELLDLTRPLRGDRDDLRGWEWHYLRRAIQGEAAAFGEFPFPASAVGFSPDGHILAVACGNDYSLNNKNGQVRVWDRRTGREIHPPLAFEIAHISAVAFSPDGRVVVASGYHAMSGQPERTRFEVRAWDAATGRHLWTREVPGALCPAPFQFAPGGATLALVGVPESDRPARLLTLDAATGTIRSDEALSGKPELHAVAFAATGALRVATAGRDDIVYLRDAATGADGRTVFDGAAVKTRVYDLVFNRPGTHLAVLTRDRQVRVWDVTGPQPVLSGVVRVEFAPPTSKLALSPDGRSVAQAQGFYGNPLVGVWDVATGQPRRVLRGHTNRVEGVEFAPDGRTLATASADRTARVWDVPTPPTWEAVRQSELIASSVAGGPSGRFSVVTRTFDSLENVSEFAVSDLETRRLRFRSPPRAKGLSRAFLYLNLQLSPDGNRVAAAAWVATDRVQVWDVETGRAVAKLPADGLPGQRAWFGTPDQLIVGHQDFALELWDLTTGTRVRRFTDPTGTVYQTTSTPDGRFLAAYSMDRALWVWDVVTGELIQSVREGVPQANALAISADGGVLAVGGLDGQIALWDVKTGRPRHTVAAHAAGVRQLLFSPDGRRLFSYGTEGLVKVWDTETGRELITFRHGEMVRGMALSPDGHRLATVQHPFDGGQVFDATPLPDERK